MTETTLSITNRDEILALFGPRDQHLRRLRKLFDVSITQRNGSVRITGEEEPVQKVARAMEKLRQLSRKQGELSVGDIDRAAAEEGVESTPDLQRGGSPLHQPATGEEINIQHAGRRIKPRTKGQALYVDAIRDHDLTFRHRASRLRKDLFGGRNGRGGTACGRRPQNCPSQACG